ncbi:hypothetical protein RJ639_045227 [Escallonia herrerae]|uniref:CNNM transmembrane domain-containing protein n=1 Tax=Escallonia herrerae TaxID=1293975 RepID=A0AA88W8S3_9ASTE|nr:hypothetical protein RJ639_045227 [Escallonia herrerae]
MAAEYHPRNKEYDGCCESQFLAISMLAVFEGIMSGLTMVLVSMSILDLEALPISLHNLVPEWINILSSVTLILMFGEITPHSVCSRYSLVIGSALAPAVQVLLWTWFPVAYLISKQLDFLIGEGRVPLLRQARLKSLVNLHGNEAGRGGELSRDETTIISGALDLTKKMAIDAMTPIAETFAIDINAKLERNLLNLILESGHSRVPETFAIDINAKLERNLLNLILESGHSRVPVYHEHPRNIVGLVLVKNLLSLNASDNVPLKNVTVRRIPSDARVSETMPLYDILNEFQKVLGHMAVVIRQRREMVDNSVKKLSDYGEVRLEIHTESHAQEIGSGSRRSLRKLKALPGNASASCTSETSRSRRWSE